MKHAFFVLIFMTSLAQAFNVRKSKDRLLLRETNCEEGQEIVSSLAQWNLLAKTGKQCDTSAPGEIKKNYCQFDITDCVPDHVVKYQGATPQTDGPNCWNLSLVMSKILPALRYSSPEEMNFYMRPPLCRQLKDGEEKIAGDVGAIRQVKKDKTPEYHGFIYISEKVAYSKNGFSRMAPYDLQSLDNVYEVYQVPRQEECRKNEITEGATCDKAVAFFRCQSMDEYLENNSNIPEKIKETFQKVGMFEVCVEDRALRGNAISKEATKNILDTSKALLNYLKQAKDSPEVAKLDKEERDFVIGSLQMRLEAISEQLAMFGGTQDGTSLVSGLALEGFAKQIKSASKGVAGVQK
ncbi:hypothetical protein [Bdellovibrio sp.]|uniref:hypothetical protein n=1 Tax=Bdellovibrio sp. TaxID=28201 RepID=UPI0039E568C6